MYVEVGRHLSVNLLEEVEKLGGAMPLVAFADDKSGGDIERCEERSVCSNVDVQFWIVAENAAFVEGEATR